jgi:hypothetical protein
MRRAELTDGKVLLAQLVLVTSALFLFALPVHAQPRPNPYMQKTLDEKGVTYEDW